MAEKCLMLSGDPWSMADEKTGELRTGVSFWYVNQYRESECGQKPTKVTGTPELYEQLKGKLPAVVDMEFGSRPGAKGVATLVVVGAKVLKSIDFSSLFAVPSGKAAAA